MPRLQAPHRRRQLLEVAADLFARRGFGRTTTAQLAKSAGVSEPILYRHFTNKLDLFVTLIDQVGAHVIHRREEALEGVVDPKDRLKILVAANPTTLQRGLAHYRIILQAITESERDPAIVSAVRRHVSSLHTFLVAELQNLQEQDVVRNDEPATALAWLLIEVTIGHGMLEPGGIAAPTKSGLTEDRHRLLQYLLCPH
ncbi:MAG: TetR/AcrR family transcriptional regulator [Phycisphaerales bacterium]